jgi:hypothetical protein
MKFGAEVNAIQGDLDAIIFNPIASIILKILRLKFVRLASLNCGFGMLMFHGNHGNQVLLQQIRLI